MDTKKNKIMKTTYLIFQALIIALMINSCTTRPCEGIFAQNNYCSYYPHKDTFNVGDTVWVQLSFPKFFSSDCGSFELKKDSIQTVVYGFNSGKVYSDSIVHYPYEFVNVVGKYLGNAEYYFLKDENNQKYVNEFYYILKQRDTGNLFIGDIGTECLLFKIKENVSSKKIYFGGIYLREGTFLTTFKETDSGYFKIYVKP